MFARATDHRTQIYNGLSLLVGSTVMSTFIFASPLLFGYQIMIAMGLSLLLQAVANVGPVVAYAELQRRPGVWLDQLTLRNGVDQVAAGVKKIDWQRATTEAAEDIKSSRSTDEMLDQLTQGKLIEFLIWLVFMPLQIFGTPIVGWLLFKLALSYAPTNWIIAYWKIWS